MKTLSFIKNLSYKSPSFSSTTQYYAVSPVVGADMGIPLNMIQNIFTYLHYGYDITTIKSVLLQILIGYYTYGNDRYKDALEYENTPFITSKQELYEFFIRNKSIYKDTYNAVFFVIASILLFDDYYVYNVPFILFLYSSEYYRDIKKINSYSKPLYISIMWTLSTVILPCVLHDHNYSILWTPIDYLPCIFTMFASSVILDIRDIKEDSVNNVPTIPVVYGFASSQQLVLGLLFLSALLFGINSHYSTNLYGNSFFEFLNAGLSVYIFQLNNTFIE